MSQPSSSAAARSAGMHEVDTVNFFSNLISCDIVIKFLNTPIIGGFEGWLQRRSESWSCPQVGNRGRSVANVAVPTLTLSAPVAALPVTASARRLTPARAVERRSPCIKVTAHPPSRNIARVDGFSQIRR